MTTYYLDNSLAGASDSNAGTSAASPFKTLSAINNHAFQPGDTISIKAGTTYQGTLSITADGTSAAPVTFNSYGSGAKPVIQSGNTSNILLNGAHYVVVDGLAATGAVRGGVSVDASSGNNVIQNSEVRGAGIGMEAYGQYNKFENNYIHDLKMVVNTPGGDDDAGAIGFGIFGSHNDFGHNKIVNAKAQSYDYGTDGGGFETWRSVTDIRIHDNWVENSTGFFEVGGMTGDKIDGIVLDHNVSLNNGDFHYLHNAGGTFGVAVGSLKISYNTIVQQSGGGTQMGFDGPVGSGYQFDHNIVDVGSGWAAFSQEVSGRSNNVYDGFSQVTPSGSSLMSGETRGDPMFMSSTDFHLRAGSPATGLGAYADTTSTGSVGSAPSSGGSSGGTTTPAPVIDPPTTPAPVIDPPTTSGSTDTPTNQTGGVVLNGDANNNRLVGGAGNDKLSGGQGNDGLFGGAGNDHLTGGSGWDTFVFDAKTVVAGGVDTITDFTSGGDMIDLGSGFAGMPRGIVSSSQFLIGTAAKTADQHILYDQGTGAVYYDADGSGSQAKVQFAQLDPGTKLTNWDFFHY